MATKPTPEQARAYAEALIAWSEGKKVEYRIADAGPAWCPVDWSGTFPTLCYACEYRIAPDPPKAREWWISPLSQPCGTGREGGCRTSGHERAIRRLFAFLDDIFHEDAEYCDEVRDTACNHDVLREKDDEVEDGEPIAVEYSPWMESLRAAPDPAQSTDTSENPDCRSRTTTPPMDSSDADVQSADTSSECPNCVSPYKCNGPHIGTSPPTGYEDAGTPSEALPQPFAFYDTNVGCCWSAAPNTRDTLKSYPWIIELYTREQIDAASRPQPARGDIDIQQVINAIERARDHNDDLASKLHEQHDYGAEFPYEDARRMDEAIALLRGIAQPACGEERSIHVECRPLLVSGMLASDQSVQITILIDSEQPEAEKRSALWHEIAHVVRAFENGSQDEAEIEALGQRLSLAWAARGEVSEAEVEAACLSFLGLSSTHRTHPHDTVRKDMRAALEAAARVRAGG
jgi:hypothetical protein